MPKDAKFGLVVGLGLVILIAVVFYRRDAVPAGSESAAAVSAASASPTPAPRGQYRPAHAKPTGRPER